MPHMLPNALDTCTLAARASHAALAAQLSALAQA